MKNQTSTIVGKASLSFEEAFDLLYQLHTQHGDPDGWMSVKEEAEYAVGKYATEQDWENDFNRRTDLSDDDKWKLDCFTDSFKVLFALMGFV